MKYNVGDNIKFTYDKIEGVGKVIDVARFLKYPYEVNIIKISEEEAGIVGEDILLKEDEIIGLVGTGLCSNCINACIEEDKEDCPFYERLE